VIRKLALGLLCVPLIITVVGCGGNLPKGTIAQVGQSFISQDQFDKLKAVNEAVGRAPDEDKQKEEYRSFEQGLAQYLVILDVLRQEAPSFKITVTEQDIQEKVQHIKEMFQGNEKNFAAALKKQNITLEQLSQSIREQLLLEEMKAAVAKDVTVTEEEAKAYYEAHKAEYVEQEAREARHILISPIPAGADGTVSAAATQADWDAAEREAEKVRSEIQNGADFATEAEKYSDDTTKESGGELGTVIRGQMVPDFEEAVFSLKKGELSQPIKTQFGYHLIEVTDITPEKQLSYDEVKEKIKSSLLAQRQAETWQAWLSEKQLALGVEYAEGFEPPSAATATSAAPSTTSTSE